MKRTIRLVNLTHLNDNYNHGNVVYASYGIAPCLTEAMGSGGAYTADTDNREGRMKRVVPATNERLANTIPASYGRGGVGATNLLHDWSHKKGGVLEITRTE